MKPLAAAQPSESLTVKPLHHRPTRPLSPATFPLRRFPPATPSRRRIPPLCQHRNPDADSESPPHNRSRRRDVVLAGPFLVLGASLLRSAAAGADTPPENSPATSVASSVTSVPDPTAASVEEVKKKDAAPAVEEAAVTSRIYDATVIGEPAAVGKDKSRVWEKLVNSRVLYLGEAEQVPVREDRELELEIVKILQSRCAEQQRTVSVALEAFPCNLQEKLDQFMDGRIDGEALKSYTSHWPPQRWEEYEPLLNYCRDNGLRLVACGTPLEILRIVQAEGIRGLSKAERKIYAPPAGSGFIAGFTSVSRRNSVDMLSSVQPSSFGPSSYLSAQARVIDEYTMSQVVLQSVLNGGSSGMLIVVAGANHVIYGSRGVGLPARISKKMQKKNQAVILLNPERQDIRREGEVPIADFLWYSAARPCSRNCFDRAEIARVMNAAGRKREALPQDLQKGLDLGLVSPEVLQNFFDLEQYPLIAELTHRFQGFRERLLADPKFLHRLAIEESISVTTTLLAQYERRKENFFEELDYVATDTLRGIVVDFFTVWLPAPTISYLSYADEVSSSDNLELLKGILGSIPDNAFQESVAGKNWSLSHRVASVLFGGLKLSGVGFVSSIGAVAASNVLYAVRQVFNPEAVVSGKNKRSPILKTALVYSGFLGTSANLRYQIIAGLVEHRISDHLLSSQPLLANLVSFVARTVNSYWGTQQWIDLARLTGLQTRKVTAPTNQLSGGSSPTTVPVATNQLSEGCNPTTALDCNMPEATISLDELKNQSGDNTTS